MSTAVSKGKRNRAGHRFQPGDAVIAKGAEGKFVSYTSATHCDVEIEHYGPTSFAIADVQPNTLTEVAATVETANGKRHTTVRRWFSRDGLDAGCEAMEAEGWDFVTMQPETRDVDSGHPGRIAHGVFEPAKVATPGWLTVWRK